jgi:hypothetical protein
MQNQKEFENMTIVTAMIQIIKQSLNSHLSNEFWNNCEAHLAFLRAQLGLSDIQIVFVAMLIERDDVLSWSNFASYLDITNFEARTYADELDELVKKGWVVQDTGFIPSEMGYMLVSEAANALINNQVFVPEEPKAATEEKTIDDDDDDNDIEEDGHHCCNNNSQDNSYSPTLKFYTDIQKKTLFFNPAEQQQIQRLTQMLSPKKFHSIQRRLTAQGMRKGVVCLLHGGPGTGKTETVLQIARQTGRDILQVDIAGLRTKWVGESLKNIKSVFRTYRGICDAYEDVPILFFNEADGIFSKRSTRPQQYCDKEENAMQNVILQEMEDFDGILIATTNLACNMDEAFERRFLYKIELKKPERDVRAKIWSSMLKNLNKNDALTLASHFDFSGGQIENIARKRIIDYILTGRYPSLNEIEAFCRSEILDSKKECHHIVGFAL